MLVLMIGLALLAALAFAILPVIVGQVIRWIARRL